MDETMTSPKATPTAVSRYVTIPSPEEVIGYRAENIVYCALALRNVLCDGLRYGKTVLDGMYSDHVVDLIRQEFLEAGWLVVNHGLSISLREVNRPNKVDLNAKTHYKIHEPVLNPKRESNYESFGHDRFFRRRQP